MSEQLYRRVVRTDGHEGHWFDFEPVQERTCKNCKHEHKNRYSDPCYNCERNTTTKCDDYYEVVSE